MLETVGQRNNLLGSIEKARDSSCIAYMLHDSALIADDAIPQIYDKLQAFGRRERLDLFLYARTGVPEVAWRILNLLRDYCSHLSVIVATRVQGAASILALGADEIVMGPLAELGGIEGARKHPLLPRDEAGQPLALSLSELKKLAGTSGSDVADIARAGGSVEALYPYIHPMVIAHLEQADALARDISRKALKMHIHPENSGQVERLVDLFNGGFHSPLYTAGRNELREAGLPIVEPNAQLWNSIWELTQLYQATIYNERMDANAHGAYYRYVCLVETEGRTTGLRQNFTQSEGQERILQVGWETAVKGPGPGPSIGPGGRSNN